MLKRILLPVIFGFLAIGFWLSDDFKVIAAGVAIFLFGMLSLEQGFRAFTGGLLERLLARTTDNLAKSIAFGIATTTIMQSSSLVSVITISFLSAGLLGLASGIGIIFGANIGTTTGAWLVAGLGLKVKLSVYAMPMLVFGIILVFQNGRLSKGFGHILAGLGFLFLGIHYMKQGFETFSSTIDLAAYAMPGFAGLLVFTLIGVVATVVMQSSHATLVLLITALSVGQVTYENALALAIGANIGTTVTAILGALSSNYEGKRLAGAHFVFNLTTGAVAIVFIHQFVFAVDYVSAKVGIAADDYTLKLAVFHTLFNVVGVAIMIPFVDRLVADLQRMFKAPAIDISSPRYLTDAVVEFPETLLEAVRNEILHLYDNAFEVMAHGLSLHRADIVSQTPIEDVVAASREPIEFDLDSRYAVRIKTLFAAILDFSSRAHAALPPEPAAQLFELREACRTVVAAVKDVKHLRKNTLANLNSDNAEVRRFYDGFRAQIAAVMRDLDRLRAGGDAVDIFDLDDHKAQVTNNVIADGTLDAVLRGGTVTAATGTSLMNDQLYVRDIVVGLVDFGIAVHGAKDFVERGAQQALILEKEEVDDVVEDSKSD